MSQPVSGPPMPPAGVSKNRRSTARHYPALDGIRAVAVALVIAYHLGTPGFGGGFLGVDIFFVLSGFLITGLLLTESERDKRIRLSAFWGRRARRLLPGLLTLLGALGVVAAVSPGIVNPYALRGDGFAALFYYANWHFLANGQSYFAALGSQSPLQHTWSLAIEEQFYLVWPLILELLLWVATRRRATGEDECDPGSGDETPRRHRSRARSAPAILGVPTVLLAIGSAAAMVLVDSGGSGLNTAYYSTYCRAFSLLLGASAAIVLHYGRSGKLVGAISQRRSLPLQAAGIASVAMLAVGVLGGGGHSGLPRSWVFEGGLVAMDGAAALLIVASFAPGPLRTALSARPICWVGRVSYELYLWHWAVIVVFASAFPDMAAGVRVPFELGVTFALATSTYYLIDAPLRRATFRGVGPRLLVGGTFASVAGLLVAIVPLGATASVTARELGTTRASVLSAKSIFGVRLAQPVGSIRLGAPPSRANKLRVMYIGDSVMYQLELAAAAALSATGEVRTSSYSAILGWSPRRKVPWTVFQGAIRRSRPEVIVAMWTQDNAFVAARGDAVYERFLDRFLAMLLSPGNGVRGVVFVSQPPQPPPSSFMAVFHADVYAPRGALEWDRAVESEATRWPGRVAYLPVTPMLSLDGGFTQWLPAPSGRWERIRQIDEFHLCLNGGVRYATGIVQEMGKLFGLAPPLMAWWKGPWAGATRWDQLPGYPPGQCPDDGPSVVPAPSWHSTGSIVAGR